MKTRPYAFAALALAVLAGCSTTPPKSEAPKPAPVETAAPVPAPAPAATPAPVPQSTVATVTLPAYLDPKSPIHNDRSVFFDFDAYAVKSEFNGLIDQHGRFLSSTPKVTIRVEGNADERGSTEYNLALGQRRADAVKKALELVGARPGQMEAISWGKGHPKNPGHDEAAWAENRRVDLVYPTN
ncbi:MAG: peptidoglycan-associated lipoprotein Pal [Burkholderiales bacterium]|nr:peptidoglycan-associated lipoprotein Pal [Burkholderiales bacterium]